MADIVCRRCGQTKEQMGPISVTGKTGELVRANVCFECWSDWHQMQIMIVNENRLQLWDADDREKLRVAMREYLSLPDA